MADLPASNYPFDDPYSSEDSHSSEKTVARKLKVGKVASPASSVRQRKTSSISNKAKNGQATSMPTPIVVKDGFLQLPRPESPIQMKPKRKTSKKAMTGSSSPIGISVKQDPPLLVTILKSLLDVLVYPLQLLLSSAQSIITVALCFAVLLAFLYYTLRQPLTNLFMPLSSIHHLLYRYPTTMYCKTIGIGCEGYSGWRSNGGKRKKTTIAALARTVADQATQAHDIFESLSAVGDVTNMGLHHTEIWELAVAVHATSNLPSRTSLSSSLKELGDLTRDVKDNLVTINSIAINSFGFTLREFKRIEATIKHIYARTGPYTSTDVSRQLDILFERLGNNLDGLLNSIELTIPKADRASLLGGTVLEDFAFEHSALLEMKENTPLWKALLDKSSYKGKQLSRDLDLAELSIENLKSARTNLEEARRFLLQYRDNVAYFKAGVIGFHLADHQLSPEHEVDALSSIMNDFTAAVDQAKRGGSSAKTPLDRKQLNA